MYVYVCMWAHHTTSYHTERKVLFALYGYFFFHLLFVLRNTHYLHKNSTDLTDEPIFRLKGVAFLFLLVFGLLLAIIQESYLQETCKLLFGTGRLYYLHSVDCETEREKSRMKKKNEMRREKRYGCGSCIWWYLDPLRVQIVFPYLIHLIFDTSICFG